MLFDLRARGRRRTVQIVYLGLALLFLVGFVGFGVGVGGGGGGIFNAFTENNGSSSASFAAKVEAAQKRTRQHPSEPAAWAALIEAQLHQASEAQYYHTSAGAASETEGYTAKGKVLLAKIVGSWNTYLKLERHPSNEVALKMVNVYGETGLAQPAGEMHALQIAIATGPPSVRLQSLLAEAAYKTGNLKLGDAASHKAVSLSPAAERGRVKKYLAELRKNPLSHTPSTISKGPHGELVATQGGKTYTVKSNGKGGFVSVTPTKGGKSGASTPALPKASHPSGTSTSTTGSGASTSKK
ncbi:MAG TPA: hypothetical protein VNV42_00755 [Solirubrobacteraceae bacterium]|jgi:hypothetical protein|nr:hypothetical protein [Solirubrobacteraceae bacterium]